MGFIALIRSDFHRYIATGGKSKLKIIFFNQGFIFTSIFRINTALYNTCKPIPVLRQLAGLHGLIWLKISQVITGISFPIGLKIGRGIFISHSGSILINGRCVIGDNCNFAPGTLIGYGIKDSIEGSPIVGNRVFFGPGAKVLGPITIGDDAMIGANAVVNKDVPNMGVAAGVPAKIVSMKGSSQYIKY